LAFAGPILIIGAAILVYSAPHLRDHPHQGRFVAFLMLSKGAMLGLVLADDLVGLYVFWELTTVAAFLLVGFDHARQAARRAGIQVVAVSTIGGLALLVGLIVLHQTTGSWSLAALRDLAQMETY